jgi:hypothetical protein
LRNAIIVASRPPSATGAEEKRIQNEVETFTGRGGPGPDDHHGVGARIQRYLDECARWTVDFQPRRRRRIENVNKIIVNVAHFDVWNYGSNFFNVDILFSNANEPANNSAGGSTEFYAVYRGQFSPDKIFGKNTAFGPISAVNFEIGGDAESENTEFAPAKKLLVVGPNFHVAVPAGFLNIGLHFSQEWNNNGISNCPNACFVHGGRVSSMPSGNVTEITEAERSTLGSWIEAGSTLD